MKYIAVGWVTKASVKDGCPKPENTAIQKSFETRKLAAKWAKAAKLRNVVILEDEKEDTKP